jgi:hypothetical protein
MSVLMLAGFMNLVLARYITSTRGMQEVQELKVQASASEAQHAQSCSWQRRSVQLSLAAHAAELNRSA